MDFDDFNDSKSETDKILKKRDKIKEQLISKLNQMNFSELQINEVLEIIDNAEAKIETVKVSLNGTNINTDDPTPIMSIALNEIKSLQLKMAIDIREKIAEIVKYNENKKH